MLKMEKHILRIKSEMQMMREELSEDLVLGNDIDFSYNFISPFSNSDQISDIKLVIIGQDPTVRRKDSRNKVNTTLNLDKDNSLRIYLKVICEILDLDLDKEVYATNLYKCFFKTPPAEDQRILTRHFKIWMDLLIYELSVFDNAIFITLGEPIIKQLFHSKHKKVRYYWDYIGQSQSGMKFKFNDSSDNYLQKRIYPIAHQPSWSQKKFYKTYLENYLEFVKWNENNLYGIIKTV